LPPPNTKSHSFANEPIFNGAVMKLQSLTACFLS
jgi:hypothetical protein